jgi:preprotein translocase subunit SecF
MAYRGFHVIPHDTRINFMRFHKITFAISVIMIVGSVLLIFAKGLNFGVDFAGGIAIEVRDKSGPADLPEMREKLSDAGLGEVSLQQFGEPQFALIRLPHQDATPADIQAVRAQLEARRPPIPADEIARRAPLEADSFAQQRAIGTVHTILGDGYEYRKEEFVGPKVGGELIQDAIIASVLALLGIMAYVWFRYEWQFAVNCIVALFHDCITTVGLFALLGLQFDLTVVAAVLTIAGFSVNDTVVIYDRIREELRRYKKMPLPELLNMSINRTLSRTIMTSGLAFLAVVAIFLFGGEALSGFSTAMMWGIVAGTYSTIFVAAPMLVYMKLRRERVSGEKPAEVEPAPKGA